MEKISLTVNGDLRIVEVNLETPLLFVLRNNLRLKGTKLGCTLEQCGACAVLVNGEKTLSCVRHVKEFEDTNVVTIEGLSKDGKPNRIQKAFIRENAAQCGYCTTGIIIAVAGLLEGNVHPGNKEVIDALNPHLCRCGSHPQVMKAVSRLLNQDMSNA